MKFCIKTLIVLAVVGSCATQISLAEKTTTPLGVMETTKPLIREFEGLKLKRYRGLGHEEYAIGYGDTICAKKYKEFSKKEAEQCLSERFVEIFIQVRRDLPHLSSNEYAAVVSLVYNVGYGAFKRSTLYTVLKSDKYTTKQIQDKWLSFNKVNGKISSGLVNRRQIEIAKFFA